MSWFVAVHYHRTKAQTSRHKERAFTMTSHRPTEREAIGEVVATLLRWKTAGIKIGSARATRL